MVLLYIVAHIRKHSWMIVNQLKYMHHNKYEILSKENVLSTQKFCDPSSSTLSSHPICRMGSSFFSFLQQQNNCKLIFINSIIKLCVCPYCFWIFTTFGMVLPIMQLCSFLSPPHCTFFHIPTSMFHISFWLSVGILLIFLKNEKYNKNIFFNI